MPRYVVLGKVIYTAHVIPGGNKFETTCSRCVFIAFVHLLARHSDAWDSLSLRFLPPSLQIPKAHVLMSTGTFHFHFCCRCL